MASKLYNRYESGDSMLSEDGDRVFHAARYTIKSLLAEAEEYGPVDLRDLQSVLHSVVDDIIITEIVSRRLGKPPAMEPPPPAKPEDYGGIPIIVEETKEDSYINFEDIEELW